MADVRLDLPAACGSGFEAAAAGGSAITDIRVKSNEPLGPAFTVKDPFRLGFRADADDCEVAIALTDFGLNCCGHECFLEACGW